MNKALKIGFVFDDSLDAPDGVQQYILTLGSWLTTQGHEVHYLVGQTTRGDIPNIHSLSKNISVRFNKNRLSIPWPVSRRKIDCFLRQEQFDVLHVQLPYSPQFAHKVIQGAKQSTAIVGTFHILPFGKLQSWGSQLLGKILSSSLRQFDQIVSVSPAAQQFAQQTMNISSTVVPNAVDLSKFQLWPAVKASAAGTNKAKKTLSKPSPGMPLKIVFLGRLVARKGCYEFLQAINYLKQHHSLSKDIGKTIQVIVGGSGPEMTRLQAYVQKHNLQPLVQFTGQLDEKDKAKFLGAGDIVVLPSLSGESFGITVVEAIAAGAGVVVGGDNPGYRFVLADTPNMLVNPRNTTIFGQLLETLIADSKLRQQAGAQQKARIAQFDVTVVGPKVIKVYNQAIENRDKKP